MALLALPATSANSTSPRPTLHPKASPLPFAHQGPFVTTGDGGVLCVDMQTALYSRDEGRTWTTTPIFRGEKTYRISSERALIRTRDGVVIAAWMNMAEIKSPPGWNWGAKTVEWRDFVVPIYVCRSVDDGKTWEKPVFLNKPWCGCIHSMIETSSGRIVLVGQEVTAAWPTLARASCRSTGRRSRRRRSRAESSCSAIPPRPSVPGAVERI